MERLRAPVVALLALAAAATFAGCTGRKTTVSTSDGNVTVDQNENGQTTTVKSSQGVVKFGSGAVDASALGIPVYPGATPKDGSSVSMNDTAKGQGGQMVTLTTGDGFDQVYDFYKSHMPAGSEKLKMAAGGSKMATFQVAESSGKDTKSVMVQESNGKVTIQLVHATKH